MTRHSNDLLKRFGRLATVAAGAVAAATAVAQGQPPMPNIDGAVHYGVASCSSPICHGRETLRWTLHDRHAQAFATLLEPRSVEIARNLGYEDARSADVCLDCHADNVPAELRGPKFQIEEGVGCEACHGGSERWLESHRAGDTAANVAAGLYPTHRVDAQARVCLSCHLGDDSRFATHDIMGAGHPRTSFELDTFVLRQPAHHDENADYQKRKGTIEPITRWMIGALSAADLQAQMIRSRVVEAGFPEVALFDCHACHRPMQRDEGWERRVGTELVGPGTVRIADGSLIVAAAIASVLEPGTGGVFLDEVRALHKTTTISRADVSQAIMRIRGHLVRLIDASMAWKPSGEALDSLLEELVRLGARGEFRDYINAEQAVMAVDLLTFMRRASAYEGVEALYEAFGDPDDRATDETLKFRPRRLQQAFARLATE